MKVVGLCGRAGAGKGSIAAIVREHFPGLQVISTGDATRRILASRGQELNHENLQAITKEIIATKGDDFLSFVFDQVDSNCTITVIDSFRRPEDVACVTKTFGPPVVLSVSALPETRFQRLLKRARASDALDEASFNDLTRLEDQWGVDRLCQSAAVKLTNVGSLLELKQQVLDAFENILGDR